MGSRARVNKRDYKLTNIGYMTDTQIFQLLGLVLFATGAGMVADPAFIKNIMRDLERSAMSVFLGGIVSLAIGYVLVTFHAVGVGGPALVITLLGWAALAKGLLLLMAPKFTMRFYERTIGEGKYIGYFVAALGSALLYWGYFA